MWPLRLTSRAWIVLVALVLVAGTVVVVLVVRDRGPDCTVRYGGRTVALDRGQADRAAQAVAYGRTRYGDTAAATAAVRNALHLGTTDAAAVGAALSGKAQAALTCTGYGTPSEESDELGPAGLTPRAERIRVDLRGHFRSLPLGGFAPGGVHSGHMPGSAHYEGRAIDAFCRPIDAQNKVRCWALAQYLVARAERFDIATVIFDGRIWTAERASEGWRSYSVTAHGRSRETLDILEHRDHVHVDVFD